MPRRWTVFLVCTLISIGLVKADDRPNLMIILADDLGYGELGCYGQTVLTTPSLDRMASEGVRFTQFYSGATVCAPSRSVLMTGLHHGHTRVRGNAGAGNPMAQALRDEDLTIAEVLKSAGYQTRLSGKWGLGDMGEAETGLPRRQGFDEFLGFLNQQHAHNHFPDFLWHNEQRISLPNEIVPVGTTGAGYATKAVRFADDVFAEDVLEFVRRDHDQPWFVFWSLVTPHANNERASKLGNGAAVPDYGPWKDKDWPDQDKGHAAMISRLDDHVGQVLDQLRSQKSGRKTLVLFSSDNGPHNESRHDLSRFSPSGPLQGIKRSLTDGGIRVPAIAWGPGLVREGHTSRHVAYLGDWFATACDAANVRPPETLDSISFLPALQAQNDHQATHEFLYWEFHEGGFRQAALFKGRWKGIRSGSPESPIRLFDLSQDIGEMRDVADQNPDVAARVTEYLNTARVESADWPAVWKTGAKSRGSR